ncbi:MAG TPA: energy transducer TonB [Anaeromyxobacteraceae bacterium]|nr:energy transducer TonB [Anaeromyxobacteraceae bacterium]
MGELHRPDRLWPVLLASLAAHAALVSLGVLRGSGPPIDLGQKPIVAKLVRLGEQRPEHWLPRRDVPPPEAPPAPARVAAAPTPVPLAVPSPKPSPKAPPPRAPAPPGHGNDALSRAISKVRRDQALARETWGDPTGSPEGTATDASEGDRYLALVSEALQANYRLPATISDQERMSLRATVVLTIEPDGRVSSLRFERRSGNDAFDQALERAVHQTRMPPPPPELQQRYRTVGLGVNFHI